MIEKKFNWKIYFFIVLFGGVLLLASRVIFLLITDQVVDEEGLPLSPVLMGFLCFMIILACSTYAITFISLLKQVITHKNVAFKMDHSGIHNAVVLINLFAFVIVANVKWIPWSSVHYIDRDDDTIYIRVKKKQIAASAIGKFVIGITGYRFCYAFITKKLSEEEMNIISSYCMNQSAYLEKNSML